MMVILFHSRLISAVPYKNYHSLSFPHVSYISDVHTMIQSNLSCTILKQLSFQAQATKAKNLSKYSSYFFIHSCRFSLIASLDIVAICENLCEEKVKLPVKMIPQRKNGAKENSWSNGNSGASEQFLVAKEKAVKKLSCPWALTNYR
ncbi:hypothetical protein TNCV_3570271 [Trichonephila clavipes]|nr:hypothetical protein TNCV_3570271 [Trichonephila clavipes]